MKTLNEVLSRYYGQPVEAGFTNGGWPVVRPSGKPEEVVAGGMPGFCEREIGPAIVEMIAQWGEMQNSLEEFDAATEDLERE